MKAEFLASTTIVEDSVWLRCSLYHLGVVILTFRSFFTMTMRSQKFTLSITKHNSKTKHIDIQFNFIRDIVG